MKFLFDLFPVILFFVAFKLQGIYVATAAAIAATFVQIGWLWLRGKRIDGMLWASFAIIVVFGGATLLLHDDVFIRWKPTVLYWLFALVLGVSERFFGRNLIRAMMHAQLQLPAPAWAKLNWSWAGFFAAMGALNLYVAFHFTRDQWVNFKLFGVTGLMLLFILAQALFLARHVEQGGDKQ
ncbi:MAG: septation protein A [Burkholderiales bacterium]